MNIPPMFMPPMGQMPPMPGMPGMPPGMPPMMMNRPPPPFMMPRVLLTEHEKEMEKLSEQNTLYIKNLNEKVKPPGMSLNPLKKCRKCCYLFAATTEK
jgi:hypothetical protein